MFSASFVLRGVMSEEGQLVVEQYDRDTRPENLHSLHTFQRQHDASVFFHDLLLPLFSPDVSPVAVANLIQAIYRQLDAARVYTVTADTDEQFKDAIAHLAEAARHLTSHLVAGSSPS